tara:strand:- start:485 stop:652 length:168 start_codon:yes stop_codon:yes gene_type:complete
MTDVDRQEAWEYLEEEWNNGFDLSRSNFDLVEIFDFTQKQARALLAEFIDSVPFE